MTLMSDGGVWRARAEALATALRGVVPLLDAIKPAEWPAGTFPKEHGAINRAHAALAAYEAVEAVEARGVQR